jgi:glucan phosphorylase
MTEGQRTIAYFSMEIGLEAGMPTYSGGLGILAGDTIRSAAKMNRLQGLVDAPRLSLVGLSR